MPPFNWLDANVFIQAHRHYYGFNIAPGFWTALEAHARADELRSPQKVLDIEIAINKDPLADWAKQIGTELFVPDGKEEQLAVGKISAHVLGKYPRAQADLFLGKADPWVIAHALVDKGTVVTLETKVPDNSQTPKIPNVCDQFGIESIDTFELLSRLGVKLTT
jgi:hypothetical protein